MKRDRKQKSVSTVRWLKRQRLSAWRSCRFATLTSSVSQGEESRSVTFLVLSGAWCSRQLGTSQKMVSRASWVEISLYKSLRHSLCKLYGAISAHGVLMQISVLYYPNRKSWVKIQSMLCSLCKPCGATSTHDAQTRNVNLHLCFFGVF